MTGYNKLREHLADMEHQQWTAWSKTLAHELQDIKILCRESKTVPAMQKIQARLDRWKKSWKPYKKLSPDAKEQDREWADKILDSMPFKCPVYQCGGLMKAVERPYPKGKNEDDFTDGMPGDFQLPDLVCSNCGAVYQFQPRRGG